MTNNIKQDYPELIANTIGGLNAMLEDDNISMETDGAIRVAIMVMESIYCTDEEIRNRAIKDLEELRRAATLKVHVLIEDPTIPCTMYSGEIETVGEMADLQEQYGDSRYEWTVDDLVALEAKYNESKVL